MARSLGFVTLFTLAVAGLLYLAVLQPNADAQVDGKGSPLDITAGIEKPVQLQVGDKLLVALAHSGGTGFFWRDISENPDVATVTFLESRSAKTRPEMVGAVESDIFQIQALRAGSTRIRFELGRAASSPTKQQTILVEVAPNT